MWRWILLWLQEIDISVIALSRRLLRRICIAESSLTLDTPQNKSRSRLLFRAYEKQTNNVDADLRLDWSQTSVRCCRFTFTYTTKSFVFLPPHITEEPTSRLDNIHSRHISKSSCNIYGGNKTCLRELMKAVWGRDIRYMQKVRSTEERPQSKHFNTRVHLKYNNILICDDQTNNDEI